MRDLISRRAALDIIDSELNGWLTEDERLHLEGVGTGIECLPTIDPVKHGKWINDKGLYKCSACENLWTTWWAVVVPEERMYKEMKYCPNCGARMNL